MRRFKITLAFSGFFGLFCMTGTGHAENFFEAIFGHFSQGGESQNPSAQARGTHPPGRNGGHQVAHRSAARPVLAIKNLGCEGADPASDGVMPKGASESASRKAPSPMTDAAITAALCKDPTLQAGDAFMTSNGLRIIEGATDSRIRPRRRSPDRRAAQSASGGIREAGVVIGPGRQSETSAHPARRRRTRPFAGLRDQKAPGRSADSDLGRQGDLPRRRLRKLDLSARRDCALASSIERRHKTAIPFFSPGCR